VKLEEQYLPRDDLEKYNAPSLGLYDPHTGRKRQIDEGH
jgi:hypothetical protein